jgi:hypothetical protein
VVGILVYFLSLAPTRASTRPNTCAGSTHTLPVAVSHLALKWKDPEDQDIVWSIIKSDNVNMSFFSRLTRVKIQVVKN